MKRRQSLTLTQENILMQIDSYESSASRMMRLARVRSLLLQFSHLAERDALLYLWAGVSRSAIDGAVARSALSFERHWRATWVDRLV